MRRKPTRFVPVSARLRIAAACERYGDFAAFPAAGGRRLTPAPHLETSGRTQGSAELIANLEAQTGCTLAREKGPEAANYVR